MDLHRPEETITDASKALALLKEGNARFVSGALAPKDSHAADRKTLAGGQHPFAVVLCCSDSRVAPEIFFDQKLGDLFVIRNAGNIVDDIVLGSIEYAVEHLDTRLVVVCGHSACGACTAAYEAHELPPHIQEIADHIRPAITPGSSIDDVIRKNVEIVTDEIKNDEEMKHVPVTVAGAYYDIETGVVTWL